LAVCCGSHQGLSTTGRHDLQRSVALYLAIRCTQCRHADPWLVPVDSLPIQTMLEFVPCPSPLAVSYLQRLCLAERCSIDKEHVLELYQSTHEVLSVDVPDSPIHPDAHPFPSPDLRRSIHQLQFQCACPPLVQHVYAPSKENGGTLEVDRAAAVEGSEKDPAFTLFRVQKHAETLSLLDSHLCRYPGDVLEVRIISVGCACDLTCCSRPTPLMNPRPRPTTK
jgi:hypothetical protein